MRRSALLLVVASAVLAGCGSSPDSKPSAAGSHAAGTSASSTPSPTGSTRATGSQSTPATSGSASPGAVGTTPPAGATSTPSATPTHNWQATPEELPIDGVVTPACVPAGGKAKLTVHTVPKGSIAFVAVYKGEKSGAAPPFGEGYGGNDRGDANSDGNWSASWTVRADTPRGDAYVILVVGKNGKQRTVHVPFAVGGVTGDCNG